MPFQIWIFTLAFWANPIAASFYVGLKILTAFFTVDGN